MFLMLYFLRLLLRLERLPVILMNLTAPQTEKELIVTGQVLIKNLDNPNKPFVVSAGTTQGS